MNRTRFLVNPYRTIMNQEKNQQQLCGLVNWGPTIKAVTGCCNIWEMSRMHSLEQYPHAITSLKGLIHKFSALRLWMWDSWKCLFPASSQSPWANMGLESVICILWASTYWGFFFFPDRWLEFNFSSEKEKNYL